jgi:DedD protein
MDQRLKQRLVGAIVLISLAVIFIPFILEGPEDEWSPRTQDMPEAPRIDYQAEVELPLPSAVPEPVEAPQPEQTAQESMDLAIPEPAAAGPAEPEPPARQAVPPEPVSKPPAPAATGPAGDWVIQVGSFSQQLNARGLRDRLQKAGYKSHLQEIKADDAPAWRVLVGPYGSREQAERQRDRITRELHLKGLVTRDQG